MRSKDAVLRASNSSSDSPSWRVISILVYCGQASRQQPQLMHLLSGYSCSWLVCDLLRPRPHVVVAVDGHPGFDFVSARNKRPRSTIRSRITGNLDIGRSSISSGVHQQLIDQCRASLTHSSVDDHRAGTANFFQTIAVPDNGSHLFAVGCLGVCRDLLQRTDDIHVRSRTRRDAVPSSWLPGSVLTQTRTSKDSGI